jgi:hypothetical protein
MQLLDLPSFAWVTGRRDVKILRHRDTSQDLWALHEAGAFEDYQNGQSWDVFGSADYLLSFIAERNRFAKFAGVWKVHSKSTKPRGYRYVTEQLPGYSDLVGRLVVEWGVGTRSWAQWLHRAGNKPVFELLPPKSVGEFPGFYDVLLSRPHLVTMMDNPEANREWHRMLSSVSGIYLILDTKTGLQYVGSAYGTNGIWARWSSYAKVAHGGNHLLMKLLATRPSAHKDLQYSILRVLEPGITRDEVLEHEAIVKRKLGSRAFGLNSN